MQVASIHFKRRAAAALDDGLDDGQAEPASAAALGGVERVEYVRDVSGLDPRTVVADLEQNQR